MRLKNDPAFYFPLESGRYEVSAGLKRLSTDFGNGPFDQQIFQFDKTFLQCRENKLTCRQGRLSKFYIEKDFTSDAQQSVNQYLIEQLCLEHPDKFRRYSHADSFTLACLLTDENLYFDEQYRLIKTEDAKTSIAYTSAIDAIANQVQEDISVVQLSADGHDYIAALHLCSPNHWSAAAKIGQSFMAAHQAVPHMEKLTQQSHKLLASLSKGGPYVRFAWGLTTDRHLNHHPEAPAGGRAAAWHGRQFDANQPELYLRVERQMLAVPKGSNIVIFLIRTYLYDVYSLQNDRQRLPQLVSAIQSMSSESLGYKKLLQSKIDILNWIQTLS